MTDDIRILLVDDHDIVRTGLRAYLENQGGFTVVGEASNGEEAVEKALRSRPDVIVMDITMPGMNGMEATRELNRRCKDCRILALTVHEDKQFFFEMMKAGAIGYLTKQVVAEELVAAIQAVKAGNVYLQPTLAGWLLDDYRRLVSQVSPDAGDEDQEDQKAPGLEILSKRELQVLELVADGLTTPQIAEELHLSPKTISRHRERIMNKLNLHSSAELIKYAIRTGLIDNL